jgi:NAD(P)H-hydrate repair Nnr-like enzyme with NAD(P)H-hydrate epimerase domain
MVLAGAVRGVAQAAGGAARGASAATTSLTASLGAGGTGSGDAFEATRILQQEGQSFNLRYLELQERLQRETREFTAVSNVMKVRHDAARAAIQNVQ